MGALPQARRRRGQVPLEPARGRQRRAARRAGAEELEAEEVAGRAEAQAMKRDRILTIKLPSPGGLEEFADPRAAAVRAAAEALHAQGPGGGARRRRPAVGEGAVARRGDRLGRDPRLPAPPLVVGLRRGRGDGHRAARHGARLDEFARAGAPLDPGCRQGRCGGERRRHRPPAAGHAFDRGNHRRLRRAMRGDREARRPHHPDGEPRARRLGEIARRLRQRLRPHPVAGEGAGDHPLAGRDVRSGAGGLLGEEGSPRRHGRLPFGYSKEQNQGRWHQGLLAGQGQGNRHAPQAAERRAHVHRRRLQLRRADRGRCAGLLGRAARDFRFDRAGGLAGAVVPC